MRSRSTLPVMHPRLFDYVDKKFIEYGTIWKEEMTVEIARQLEERVAHTSGRTKFGRVTDDQSPPLLAWDDVASAGSAWQLFTDLQEAFASHSTRLSSFEKRLNCSEEALDAVQASIPAAFPKKSSCAETVEDADLKNTTINETILEELRRLQDVISAVLVTSACKETRPKTPLPESPDLRWLHNVEPSVGLCNNACEERRNLRFGVQSVPLPRLSFIRSQCYADGRIDRPLVQAASKGETCVAIADDHSASVN
mmetsp:Transcript_99427/g.197005  ORF Transcript_99427/g.197005 Transcript_99427/m.197005 type:complete len:254 (+) Transcript_99427:42-803(+)